MNQSHISPKTSKADYRHRALSAVIESIPLVGPAAGELFRSIIPAPLEKDLFEWRNKIAAAIHALGNRVDDLEQKEIKFFIKNMDFNTDFGNSCPLKEPQQQVTWDVVMSMAQLPKNYCYQVFKLETILPSDVMYLNEPSRRSLRLPVEFRERYLVESFSNLRDDDKFNRIPNGDYHINLLLSDSAYRNFRPMFCGQIEMETFKWLPIVDEKVVKKYAVDISVMFLGHNKVHRTTNGKEPGLFFEVLGEIKTNTA